MLNEKSLIFCSKFQEMRVPQDYSEHLRNKINFERQHWVDMAIAPNVSKTCRVEEEIGYFLFLPKKKRARNNEGSFLEKKTRKKAKVKQFS